MWKKQKEMCIDNVETICEQSINPNKTHKEQVDIQ